MSDVLTPRSRAALLRVDKPHFVYRFWDREGRCLYVGMTASPAGRISTHAANAPWWRYVDHFDAELHPDRATARAAEEAAIVQHEPRWNFYHSDSSVGARSGHGHGGVAFTRDDVLNDRQ